MGDKSHAFIGTCSLTDSYDFLIALFPLNQNSESINQLAPIICDILLYLFYFGNVEEIQKSNLKIITDHPRNQNIGPKLIKFLIELLESSVFTNIHGKKLFLETLKILHERCLLHLILLMSKASKTVKTVEKKYFVLDFVAICNSVIWGDSYFFDRKRKKTSLIFYEQNVDEVHQLDPFIKPLLHDILKCRAMPTINAKALKIQEIRSKPIFAKGLYSFSY